jgi:hypothetical protein
MNAKDWLGDGVVVTFPKLGRVRFSRADNPASYFEDTRKQVLYIYRLLKENYQQRQRESKLAREVRQWISDYHLMHDSGVHQTAILVYLVNWATNPNRLRTSREHRVLRRVEHWARKRLAGRSGWHEMEDGKLWASGRS